VEAVRVPAEILAVEFAVIDGDVFGVPECVFRIDDGIAYHDVGAVLKRIVAVLAVTFDIDIAAVHEEIIGVGDFDIAQSHVRAVPECFGRIGNSYSLEAQIVHLAEHFRGFDESVAHDKVLGVP